MNWTGTAWDLLTDVAWKGTLILSAGCLLAASLRRYSAAARHMVWLSTFAALAALPILIAVAPTWRVTTMAPLEAVFSVSSGHAAASASWQAADILVVLWMAVAALLVLRLGWAHAAMAIRARRAEPLETRGAVKVLRSPAVAGPLAWGVRRPLLLVPQTWPEWTVESRRDALAHELAHVTRGDCAALLLMQFVTCLYWFHPLVWWAVGKAAEERERACDDLVLSAGASPAAYAHQLIELARTRSVVSAAAVPMVRRSGLESRIRAILDSSVNRTGIGRGAVTVAVLAVLGASLPLASLRGQARSGNVYSIADGVTAPKVLKKVDPWYTEAARAAGIQGTVTLQVVISEDGHAEDIAVVTSLDPGLDSNAIAAVQQWDFQPGTLDGKTVPVRATIEINFRMADISGMDENSATRPKVIKKVEPEYTEAARNAGIEGTVTLQAVISEDGTPRNISVLRGVDPGLDTNAEEALTQWKFTPGMRDGKPVPTTATIELNFRLK